MGIESSTTKAIYFISSVIIASTVVGIFSGVVYSISSGISERGDDVSEKMKSDIIIINDPTNVPNDPVIIYVKNTGSSTLDGNSSDLLVNGSYHTDVTITVIGGGTWKPSEVISIQANNLNLATGDHRVKVFAETGIYDQMTINIP